jgi:hypothetical protein
MEPLETITPENMKRIEDWIDDCRAEGCPGIQARRKWITSPLRKLKDEVGAYSGYSTHASAVGREALA